MTTFNVRFTDSAAQSIEDQIVHLADYSGVEAAYARLDALVGIVEAKLKNAPLGYPVSDQASSLGVLQYRELNTDGFRVFYEVYESEKAIVVGLVLRQIQSVEQALIRYCLINPW